MANKTDITNNINTRFPDNTNGDISAEDLRIVTQQILENTLNTDPTGSDIVTQAEAEAGTGTGTKLYTPERVAQAIAALSPSGGWTTSEINTTTVTLASNYTYHATAGGAGLTGDVTIGITDGTTRAGYRGYMLHTDSTAPTIAAGTNVVLNFIKPVAGNYTPAAINYIEWEVRRINSDTYYVDVWVYQAEDVTYPQLLNAVVENAAPTDIVLTFSEAMTLTNLGFTAGGTTDTTPNSLSGSGTTTVTLTLGTAVANGETVTLNYSQAIGDALGASGLPLQNITNFPVTNNVGAGLNLVPGFASRFFASNDADNIYDVTETNVLISLVDSEGRMQFDEQGSGITSAPLKITDTDGNIGISWEQGYTGGVTREMESAEADRTANFNPNECTIFIALDNNNSAPDVDIFDFRATTSNLLKIEAPNSTDSVFIQAQLNGANQTLTSNSGVVPLNGKYLLTLRLSQSSNMSEVWVNNTLISNPAFSGAFQGTSTLDGVYELMTNFEGILYDLVIYESVLSDSDVDTNRTGLIAEYNIS